MSNLIDLKQLFGLDVEGLCNDVETFALPAVVPGRVAHIDGDFIAYIVSAEKKDDDGTKTLDECIQHLRDMVEGFRQLAGAEFVKLHLTPTGSDKGKRYEIALLKQYQGNRLDKPKPRYLHLIRDYMVDHMGGTGWMDREADDGMAEAQWKAYLAGNKELSIIVSKDKDLRQIPGLHLNWDTGEIEEIDITGHIELKVMKSGKKIYGSGGLFFFAQLLRGDTADNISGLPVVHRDVLNHLFPTKEVEKAMAILRDPSSNEGQVKAAEGILAARNHKACGDTMAWDLLQNAKDLPTAFKIVSTLFKYLEGTGTLKNYRDGAEIGWQQALISEAKLLWMRRNGNPDDVVFFLHEYCK